MYKTLNNKLSIALSIIQKRKLNRKLRRSQWRSHGRLGVRTSPPLWQM